MNSTGSFQPRWAKSRTVTPFSSFKSKVSSVPIHSLAPSTHFHFVETVIAEPEPIDRSNHWRGVDVPCPPAVKALLLRERLKDLSSGRLDCNPVQDIGHWRLLSAAGGESLREWVHPATTS